MSSPDQPSAPELTRREARRERRAARREAMYGWAGPSIGGVVLVILGLVLLAQNMGLDVPDRWWALLLLIPAIGSLVAAIRAWRGGAAGTETLIGLVAAAIFTVLALALFFGVEWGALWPVVLILAGGGLIFRSWQRGAHHGD
jgi:hypothetical protein